MSKSKKPRAKKLKTPRNTRENKENIEILKKRAKKELAKEAKLSPKIENFPIDPTIVTTGNTIPFKVTFNLDGATVPLEDNAKVVFSDPESVETPPIPIVFYPPVTPLQRIKRFFIRLITNIKVNFQLFKIIYLKG